MADFPLLKEMIDRRLVEQIADRIAVAHPPFDRAGFIRVVMADLDSLELKARNWLIATKLREFLPAAYPRALRILVDILNAERGFPPIEKAGLRLMAIPTFVELYGGEHPHESLDAMSAITRVSSCEFAIRPLIERHSRLTMQRLHAWAQADDEHLRRLASEGSRPRLPWAPRLAALIVDPGPSFALLERLKDDPSLYVRRSVANHLNDIGKDHPHLLLERMEAWSPGAGKERKWLINHALRSLAKAGDRRALDILGFGEANLELKALQLHPAALQFGDALEFSFELRNCETVARNLMIDFILHFRKANGTSAPKVFKLKKLCLAAGETVKIQRELAIRQISTRRYYPGRQRLEIQVNGVVLGGGGFELVMA